uniref:Uncharacterized protein n=1 Tax=Rhizophora mucronata TaxID=61149 RepID=A0A2P2K2W0_RHIMU
MDGKVQITELEKARDTTERRRRKWQSARPQSLEEKAL